MEEPSEDGVDPVGVSSTPLSATVYPLRSTFESDGAELGEWGLLRRNVHVYVVFYKTRCGVISYEAPAPPVAIPFWDREAVLFV